MNRYKRQYSHAVKKSIKHSCLAEYWAWKARIAHSSDEEDLIEDMIVDLEDFALRSCKSPEIEGED